MQGSQVLAAFCADLEGNGGLYICNGSGMERIDGMNSSSGATRPGELVRLLWSQPGEDVGLLIYDRTGLLAFRRLKGHGDAHHVAVYGGGLVIASTGTNSIITLNSALEIIDQWIAPGQGDAWHINGVFVREKKVYVSAFGRFAEERGWNDHRTDGSGIVFDLETGEDVLANISAPHHPRVIDGNWVVCSSSQHKLLVIEPSSKKKIAEVDLGGWTRGIAETADSIFVGVSAARHDPQRKNNSASVAVLCRRTFKELERIPIQAQEIGDLCTMDRELLEGCRLVEAQPPFASALLNAPAMPPFLTLNQVSLQVQQAPASVPAGSRFHIQVRLLNHSGVTLMSRPPYPIHLSYHCYSSNEGLVKYDGLRTRIPVSKPGGALDLIMDLEAPAAQGRFRFRLAVVQERARWFDEKPHTPFEDCWIDVV